MSGSCRTVSAPAARRTIRFAALALSAALIASFPAACGTDEEKSDEADAPSVTGLDRLQRAIHASVSVPARWFDRLFGDARAFAETDTTYGHVRVGAGWDEMRGWEALGQAKIKVSLPAAERRLGLILGRVPEDRVATEGDGDEGDTRALDADDQEWLLGLAYTPIAGKRHRVGTSVGVHFASPLETYVRLRYRALWPLGERTALRWQLTPYWQDGDRQFGARSSLDVDHRVGPRMLVRWYLGGTNDDRTDGALWNAGTTLYHRLGPRHAIAHFIEARGATDAEVPTREYGYRVTYRRQVARPWLFVEVGAGIVWRRELLIEPRRPVGLGLLMVEVQFGEDREAKAGGGGEPEPRDVGRHDRMSRSRRTGWHR